MRFGTGMSGVGTVAVSNRRARHRQRGNPNLASTSTDRTVFYGVSLAFGLLSPSNGGGVIFTVANTGGQLTGFFSYSRGSVSFFATRFTSLVISGQTATFEGFSSNGRLFVATMYDVGGPRQRGDQFRLWIDGVEQTAGGGLSGGPDRPPWAPTRGSRAVSTCTRIPFNIALAQAVPRRPSGLADAGVQMLAIRCRIDQRATSIAERFTRRATRGDPSIPGRATSGDALSSDRDVNGAAARPSLRAGSPVHALTAGTTSRTEE